MWQQKLEVIKEIEDDTKLEYVLSFDRVAERRGVKKGRAETARRAALRMLSDGFELEIISKYTDLPVEEIKELSAKGN